MVQPGIDGFTYEEVRAAYGNRLAKQLLTQCLGVSRVNVIFQPLNAGCLFKLL